MPRSLAALLIATSLAASVVAGAAQSGPAPVRPSAARDVAPELPLDHPRPMPGVRPDAATIRQWQDHKFGMFIHFGLYSIPGGMWNGERIDRGYSEQIVAHAPLPMAEYEKLAGQFDPRNFDPDAIAALAKAAGMKFIVLTAKHHDGFALFKTRMSRFNAVDGTPYGKDILAMMAAACRRADLAFGVYYSTIDWHQPQGNAIIESNSNPITPAQAAFNVAQLKELATNYGPLSEVWFDMGKPTAAQSARFAATLHAIQPQLMISGRVWNHQGDFTVMSDNALPRSEMEEPWQAPASVFDETWGYRSWQRRVDLPGKIAEHIDRLAKVVSAGGNYILNIGPMGDGSVVPYEASVLRGVGDWLKINGEAIYGTARQPFDELDFGYASVGPRRLYLFVRDLPPDGRLHLPGVVGTPFGAARVLGLRDINVTVRADADGSWIDAADLKRRAGATLPVIAIDLERPLVVRPANVVPAASSGAVRLLAGGASRFQSYNGAGYEDPARIYKLRWYAALGPGSYRATVRFAAPVASATTIALQVDGMAHPLRLTRGMTSATASVRRDPAAQSFAMQVAVTPAQPFTRADALPVTIREVTLER